MILHILLLLQVQQWNNGAQLPIRQAQLTNRQALLPKRQVLFKILIPPVTGTAYTAPGNPVALSKHSTKDEFAAMSKGKGKTDLSAYVDLSAQDLHSGFLNRLYTSRDYEAGLVNLMKERYEVNSFALCSVPSLHCSSQGPVCL